MRAYAGGVAFTSVRVAVRRTRILPRSKDIEVAQCDIVHAVRGKRPKVIAPKAIDPLSAS